MDEKSILIVGANGQLGRALQAQYPGARAVDIDSLDISNPAAVSAHDWTGITTILNAAAYTNVDGAETAEGRAIAWQANAVAPRNLAQVAAEHGMTLVHISSDYVFDGTKKPHTENELFSPLSVYGSSKAAGDIAVSTVAKHYILRATWVIGEGKNFVRTMLDLAEKGIHPSVVSDQVGRLTFTAELVRAINHLLTSNAPAGTYNLTNSGDSLSWADIARAVYKEAGLDNTVTDITTAEYFKDKPEAAARPLESAMDLSKIQATGFASRDWRDDLTAYIKTAAAA